MQERLNVANRKIIKLQNKLQDAECGVLKDKTVRAHVDTIKLKNRVIANLFLALGSIGAYSIAFTAISIYMGYQL